MRVAANHNLILPHEIETLLLGPICIKYGRAYVTYTVVLLFYPNHLVNVDSTSDSWCLKHTSILILCKIVFSIHRSQLTDSHPKWIPYIWCQIILLPSDYFVRSIITDNNEPKRKTCVVRNFEWCGEMIFIGKLVVPWL